MATEKNPATPATPATPAKAKTVLDDMPSRAIRADAASAGAYIVDAFTSYADFGEMTIVSPVDVKNDKTGLSMDDAGNLVFDPDIFPESMDIAISVLTERGEGPNSSRVKGIVVYPQPRLSAIMADETGQKWLQKIVETELNRTAVRNLRDKKANLGDVALLDSMPRTLTDYVTSNRGGSSTLLEGFELFWRPIKTGLGKLNKPWRLANLSKRELKNAMMSAAYARQYYPTLETVKGKDKTTGEATTMSLFVFALQAFMIESEKAGKDKSIFDQWLSNRNEYNINEDDEDSDEDEDDAISFDSLSAAMAVAPATPEPAAESLAEGVTGDSANTTADPDGITSDDGTTDTDALTPESDDTDTTEVEPTA